MAEGTFGTARGVRDLTWQQKAWRFYGTDDVWTTGAPTGVIVSNDVAPFKLNQGAVGEVRYTLGWLAFQVGRLGWDITIDGVAVSEEQQAELLAQVANQDTTVQIATNLVVAGELYYCAFDKEELTRPLEEVPSFLHDVRRAILDAGPALPQAGDKVWLPVSVVFPSTKQVVDAAAVAVRGVWPHPANPSRPDPPLRGVLDVLEVIEQLGDVGWAQNNSRVVQMGILEVAKEYSFVGKQEGSDFHNDFQEATSARMRDPRQTGGVPITVTAPGELIGKGLHHTTLTVDADQQLEEKMRFAIQRLAWGFPVPPEVLLGMTSTNRATAYQIEESTYEANVEPIANLIGRIYAAALAKLLARTGTDDESDGTEPRVEVNPNATELLARKHSVPDLQWAYVNGLVKALVVLEAMGLTVDDMAEPTDLERIKALRGTVENVAGTGTTEMPMTPPDPGDQPGVVAGLRWREAVAAAGSATVDLEKLTARLADVDVSLLDRLTAAAGRDVTTAFSRLGAQARTRLRALGPGGFEQYRVRSGDRNADLPFHLGVERLRALGLDPRATLVGSLLELAAWWREDVLPTAYEEVRELLLPTGAVLPPVNQNGQFTRSADALVDGLAAWGLERLELGEVAEVPLPLLRDVLAVAGRP